MGGLFAAILYTTSAKMAQKPHGVTQNADGINTIPVKHQKLRFYTPPIQK